MQTKAATKTLKNSLQRTLSVAKCITIISNVYQRYCFKSIHCLLPSKSSPSLTSLLCKSVKIFLGFSLKTIQRTNFILKESVVGSKRNSKQTVSEKQIKRRHKKRTSTAKGIFWVYFRLFSRNKEKKIRRMNDTQIYDPTSLTTTHVSKHWGFGNAQWGF